MGVAVGRWNTHINFLETGRYGILEENRQICMIIYKSVEHGMRKYPYKRRGSELLTK
jgi:hypothetical protein